MADSRVFIDPTRRPNRMQAGIISRIRLENFMCHSNLEIEFGDWVNFITGQNGSGKSAILTALCVAFGSRARGTQRANTMKDFIKTGCSHALVQVEIKNQGEDAFKPELYGDIIIVDRRISESTSSITLKNSQGRRVGTKKEDLREIVEHFNIDVENPCVIMSQDKSREFLHSGNAKDKFKFFFKATLLQQVDDLLKGIEKQVNDATALVKHLEESLRPILKELDELQEKIKNMEFVEEISQQLQLLRKKLAWSWVYDADRELDLQGKLIEKLKGRIPSLQARIDLHHHKVEELSDLLAKKKSQISNMMERTFEVRRMKEDLQQSLSIAVKERLELDGEQDRMTRQIQKMVQQVKLLEQQIHDLHEQILLLIANYVAHKLKVASSCSLRDTFPCHCSKFKMNPVHLESGFLSLGRLFSQSFACKGNIVQSDIPLLFLWEYQNQIILNYANSKLAVFMVKEIHRLVGSQVRVSDTSAKGARQFSFFRPLLPTREMKIAEENEMEERLRELQTEVDEAYDSCQRLKEEEDEMAHKIAMVENEIVKITNQIEDVEKRHHDIYSRLLVEVTAFGGGRVIGLLQAIERNQHKFSSPPIGPIGAHVKLEDGDMWSMAIETAVGRVLNAFIVTDHQDARTLRACAKEVSYNHLQIIIYDFSRPRIDIPRHMLPQTNHPTAFSVMRSDNPTVLNVLIDVCNVVKTVNSLYFLQAGAERQVLVKDYDVGKMVAFDQRISNLKEVYTSDGCKMFCRGSSQTILPPNKNLRAGRLCGSFDHEINYLERDALEAKESAQQGRGVKRAKEEELRNLQHMLSSVKRRHIDVDRKFRKKGFELEDVKKSLSSEASAASASTVDELHQDISVCFFDSASLKLHDEIREKEILLEKLQNRVNEAGSKVKDLKVSFENLCESAKSEIDALAEAERELMMIEKDLHEAEGGKKYYEGVMNTKVLSAIKDAEAEYRKLEHSCQIIRSIFLYTSHMRHSFTFLKWVLKQNLVLVIVGDPSEASVLCPECEIEALGGCKESNTEQLSAQLDMLKRRHARESQRFPESIDDLRMLFEKKERKISRKQQTYKAFREKLEACENAVHLRWCKFQRNATLLKRQLTWQFNGHLKKKGISGQIRVSYEEQTLSVEVKMPQDASSNSVRDTRGLSGGERSFSTLCFALALHEMTEAPFRAMDEFDVFMDAVSRKISLDAIVDFALAQGSQWIFITPHDISMVKHDERIKKQQMAAPRG
ncbi:hypothetical protein DH2020_010129 [Rehmannia glutinosa]|uniref:RecF/RecN/SMC N-terminal domain-containing protein n=1 Tax=Rehmannia glutinosa TaxID=99300 RepID=A0ABR0X9T1_REHGL